MGRSLEFALATLVIYTIHIVFTFFIGNTIGKYVLELFTTISIALTRI